MTLLHKLSALHYLQPADWRKLGLNVANSQIDGAKVSRLMTTVSGPLDFLKLRPDAADGNRSHQLVYSRSYLKSGRSPVQFIGYGPANSEGQTAMGGPLLLFSRRQRANRDPETKDRTPFITEFDLHDSLTALPAGTNPEHLFKQMWRVVSRSATAYGKELSSRPLVTKDNLGLRIPTRQLDGRSDTTP